MGGRWDRFLGLGRVVISDINLEISAVGPTPRCGFGATQQKKQEERRGGDFVCNYAAAAANVVDRMTQDLRTRPARARSKEGERDPAWELFVPLPPLRPLPRQARMHHRSSPRNRAKIRRRVGV